MFDKSTESDLIFKAYQWSLVFPGTDDGEISNFLSISGDLCTCWFSLQLNKVVRRCQGKPNSVCNDFLNPILTSVLKGLWVVYSSICICQLLSMCVDSLLVYQTLGTWIGLLEIFSWHTSTTHWASSMIKNLLAIWQALDRLSNLHIKAHSKIPYTLFVAPVSVRIFWDQLNWPVLYMSHVLSGILCDYEIWVTVCMTWWCPLVDTKERDEDSALF